MNLATSLRIPFLAAAILCSSNYAVGGIVLFDNGVTNPNTAYFSDSNFSPQFVADNFSVSQTSKLEAVFWSGIYGTSPRQDDFTIEIMVDSNPAPTAFTMTTLFTIEPAQVTRTATTSTVIGRTLFRYEVDVSASNVELESGREFWINVRNHTNDGRWSFASNNATGTFIFDNSGRDTINAATSSLDFRLEGTAVPEPHGLLLLSAIAGVIACRRQRI